MASIQTPLLSTFSRDFSRQETKEFIHRKRIFQTRNLSFRGKLLTQLEGRESHVNLNGFAHCNVNFFKEKLFGSSLWRADCRFGKQPFGFCREIRLCPRNENLRIISKNVAKGNARKALPASPSSIEPETEAETEIETETKTVSVTGRYEKLHRDRGLTSEGSNKRNLKRKSRRKSFKSQEDEGSEWRDYSQIGVDKSSLAVLSNGTKTSRRSEDEWSVLGGDIDSQEGIDGEDNRMGRLQGMPMVDRVYALRDRVQAQMAAGEDVTVTPRDIARLFDFSVDTFQRLAISAFLEGSSVVVCAPTSSGKTLIAEAAAAAVMAKGERLFYTTPLKALSNQKLRDFRERFGEENVGLLTGDAAVNREAPIVVMTTEILRNMLYCSVGSVADDSGLANVSAVVLDEVHYLSDKSRGTVWEETVIYCPKEVKLVCLSATVANPEELAGWIAAVHGPTELVTSNIRPVPLMWHFSTKEAILPLLNEYGNDINRRLLPVSRRLEDSLWGDVDPTRLQGGDGEWGFRTRTRRGDSLQPPRIVDTLLQLKKRDMLPIIWFIFSRRGCDQAVDFVSKGLVNDEDFDRLVNDEESLALTKAVNELRENSPEAVRETAVNPLLRGIAAHHAGCLPAWKSFVEELYQRGLVKVVFATETLAAGINMPARTTVLATLSKRGDVGHALLSSNAMLQMAGRAGRRGQDKLGHVVIVQTRFEGAEEACRLLFAGPDPLVSQFTATYGMALNLLAGSRKQISSDANKQEEGSGQNGSVKEDHDHDIPMGRTMDEAKSLVERSFGNYLGNEVVVEARKQVKRLEEQAERLLKQKEEREREGFEGGIEPQVWEHYQSFRHRLRMEKESFRHLRKVVSTKRIAAMEPQLEELANEKAALVVIMYQDSRVGQERELAVLYVKKIPRPFFASFEDKDTDDEEEDNAPQTPDSTRPAFSESNEYPHPSTIHTDDTRTVPHNSNPEKPQEIGYHVGLGADNRWYCFTSAAVRSIHNAMETWKEISDGEAALHERMQFGSREWSNVGLSGGVAESIGSVWSADGSMNTWKWSSIIPMPGMLHGDDVQENEELMELELRLEEQRKRVAVLLKQLKNTRGYKEHQLLMQNSRRSNEKLTRVQANAARIRIRLSKMQPAGWEEFVQVVNVLESVSAINLKKRKVLPLGQVAASIRGANELWLALVLMDSQLSTLSPAQLAGMCAMLVSDGVKVQLGAQDRFQNCDRSIYQTSSTVLGLFHSLIKQRMLLEELQEDEGVDIPCVMDPQFGGLAEAWASGVSWKELMDDQRLDEGDMARLLRRTIDLLSQIQHVPMIEPSVGRVAKQAAGLMDRPPISELIG